MDDKPSPENEEFSYSAWLILWLLVNGIILLVCGWFTVPVWLLSSVMFSYVCWAVGMGPRAR